MIDRMEGEIMNSDFKPYLPTKDQLSQFGFWTIEDYNRCHEKYINDPTDLKNAASLLSTLQYYISMPHIGLFAHSKDYYTPFLANQDDLFNNKKQAALESIEILKIFLDNPYAVPTIYMAIAQNYFIAGDIDNSLIYHLKLLNHDRVKKGGFPLDNWDYQAKATAAIVHNIRLLLSFKGDTASEKVIADKYSEAIDALSTWVDNVWIMSNRDDPESDLHDVEMLNEYPLKTFFVTPQFIYSPIFGGSWLTDRRSNNLFTMTDYYELHENYLFRSLRRGEEPDYRLIERIAYIPQPAKSVSSIPQSFINNQDASFSSSELVSNTTKQKPDLSMDTPSFDSLMAELNGLVGLNDIKSDVEDLVGLVKMQKLRESKGLKTVPVSLHLVFTGNPGTGKTTVARILAEIYKEIGVLKSGQLIEVDRSGLVAGYVGQTAIKTQEKINEAIGGVLFIDEAYTLAKEGNDYGQEAIDTILKAMEDRRNDFVVIVAGYSEPMHNFINSNPGLKSRFNKYFYFADYSGPELIEIFDRMCKKFDYKLTMKPLPSRTTRLLVWNGIKGKTSRMLVMLEIISKILLHDNPKESHQQRLDQMKT